MIIFKILEKSIEIRWTFAILCGIVLCCKGGAEAERTLSLSGKHDDSLCNMLTDEQKEQYEKFHDIQNKLSCLLEQEAFADGFCLAIKIMVEVMNTMENPLIED